MHCNRHVSRSLFRTSQTLAKENSGNCSMGTDTSLCCINGTSKASICTKETQIWRSTGNKTNESAPKMGRGKIGRRLGLGYADVLGLSAPHSFSQNITQKNFSSPPVSFSQYFMCPSYSLCICIIPNFMWCLIHYILYNCNPNTLQSLMF